MKLTTNEWLRGAGRQMKQDLVAGVLMAVVLLGVALGQAASAQAISTTTVQGTVYLANGQPGAGTVVVSWPSFTTANGQSIVAGRITATIAPDGFLSVNLAPNLSSTPAGLYYTAVYYMSDGSSSTQYWVVPAAAQASLAQVQSQVMPAAQAVQAASKAYVDQAIEALGQGVFTLSGGTMTGPLLLNGDPTQALQAADKHYVDTSVSQAVPLTGGSVTGTLTAQQLGAAYQVDQFAGADFGAKLQACLSAVSATDGGTCDARNFTGTQAMGSNLTIATGNTTVELPCATIATANQLIVTAGTRNVTLRGCALRGGTQASGSQGGTVFAYAGTAAMVQVGDPSYAVDTQGFHMDDVVINTTAAASSTAKGLVAYRTQEMDLESLYFLGNSNQTGMTLDGTGNYTGGTYYDNAFNGFQTAVNAIGHQVSNGATTDWMNASTFVRLHIDCPTSGGNPIAGTYGINLQQGDGNTFTGGDVEGCSTALHLGANAQNNTILGLRNENSTSQVVADAGSSYNSWMTGGTMFTGKLTDNGTRNSFLDTFHRSFNGMNGDWYGSQQDATVTNHYRLGTGTGNERGLLNRYQTDYGYRWTMGLSDATAGEQFYQVLDELNNVYRISVGQYNNGQASTNNQTVVNSAGTGAVVLNGSTNAGTGGVVFGSGGTTATAVATINNAGNAQFNGTLQVGGASTFIGTATVKNQADAEVDQVLWAGATASQKESVTYKDWNGTNQWYALKDASNNWALNSAPGGLDSFKAYQSTNSGDTYVNASNASGVVRVNYESGAGAAFKIYGGSSSSLYASFTGTTSIQFPGLAAGSGHFCLQIDNSGYVTNTGTACGSGSGGVIGTVNSGNTGQIAYYTTNGTIVGGTNTVPMTAGGTGAATPAGAISNLINGNAITPSLVSVGPNSSNQMQFSQTRGIAGYVTPELYGARGNGVTDDTAAIQDCWDASSASGLTCRMDPSSGTYLANEQLSVVYNMHVAGNSQNGTFIKSEFNGAAVTMNAGVNNDIVMENLGFNLDKSLPNSAGFYFIAVPTGSPAQGGLWYSEFKNISINNPAKECIRLDGGGPSGYTFNYPNQALQFNAFTCTGPTGQSHPANLVEISGQMGQVVFRDSIINGDSTSTGTGSGTTYTYYPNALVLLQPYGGTAGLTSPTNVTFSNVSVQSAQRGFDLNSSVSINLVDGSHFEDLGTLVNATGGATASIHDDYMGNVGTTTVVSAGNLSAITLRDNLINWSSGYEPAALATCTSVGTVYAANNYAGNGVTLTSGSGCATQQQGISTSSLTVYSPQTLLNGDGGATPITTITGPVAAPGTIEIHALGNSFVLSSGGNIQFGSFPTPLTIPAGTTVTLRRYDFAITWEVESVNGTINGYGLHGASGTKVQMSDGTGASGDCVKFASDGSMSDSGGPCSGNIVYPGAGVVVSTGATWGTSLTAPSGVIVGTTDTQTLTNKTIDGVTPTTMGYLDATSSIQTQLNGKQTTLTNPVTGPGSGATVGHLAVMGNTSGTSITDGGAVPTLSSLGAVSSSTTVNGHALSSNVTVSASDLTTGTLPTSAEPAHTGDVTNPGGSLAMTVKGINGTTLSGLATGLLKNTTSTGVPVIATAGTDYVVPSGSITGTAANVTATSNSSLTTLSALSLPYSQLSGAVPTWNQSTTGNAATASLATTSNGLSGTPTSGQYWGYNGSSQGWNTPAGGGNVSNSGTPTSGQYAVWANATAIQGQTGVPYAALTGTVPTWNQDTSGNAATASALAATPTLCSAGTAPTGILANGNATGCAVIGGGSGTGTVTLLSAGNLSPLFTSSVATATTTPALSFTLSSAAQNSVLAGPASGGAGVPSYQTAPTISAANMTNFPTFNQNTTGNAATATTAATATNLAGTGVDYAPFQSASGTTSYIAAPTTSGHTFVYGWQPSGSAVAPTALDLATWFGGQTYSGALSSSQVTTALTYTPVAPSVTTLSSLTAASGGTFGTAAFTASSAYDASGAAAARAAASACTAGQYATGTETSTTPCAQVNYSQLGGTVPTWNQNTTGTAANVTATSNSTLTTLSALSLPVSQVSGTINATQVNGAALPTSASLVATNSSKQLIAAPAANVAALLAALTGCTTATYVYSPADGKCNAPGGGGSISGLTSGVYPIATGSTSIGNGNLDETTHPGALTVKEGIYAIEPSQTDIEAEATSGAAITGVDFGTFTDGTPADDFAAFYAYDGVSFNEIPFNVGESSEIFIYPVGNPDFTATCQGCVGINTTAPDYPLDVYGSGASAGIIDAGGAGGGYKINGAAPSGHYLRGNGTLYVDSAIESDDLPLGTPSAPGALQVGSGLAVTSGTVSSSTATTFNAALGSNTTMTSTSTFYDGPTSGSLVAGSYFVTANATISKASATTGTTVICKLWDGTTTFASTQAELPYITAAAVTYATVSLSSVVTEASSATLKMSCEPQTGNEIMYATTPTGTLGSATSISGFRLK